MKAHLAKVSLALLSAAFLLGCQEQGSEPVGPEGPQFDKPNNETCSEGFALEDGHCHGAEVNQKLIEVDLFEDVTGRNFTCEFGATNTGDSFGKVGWQTDRIHVGEAALPASDHIHFQLQLTGVPAGDYTIFGNQFEDLVSSPSCDETGGETVDIGTVKVKKNGKLVTPGILQFEFPFHEVSTKLKDPLTTYVWLTISGPGGIFRSTAVEVVIPPHEEVQ